MKRAILLLLLLLVAATAMSAATDDQQIVYYGRNSWLGVALADPSAQTGKSQRAGAQIRDVFPDGPAAKAGLRPGDLIVGFNGRKVTGVEDLHAALASATANQTATVAILRNGQPQSLQVRIEQPPPQVLSMHIMPPLPPIPPVHIPPIHIPEIHIPPMPPMPPNVENFMGMSAHGSMSLGMSVETMPDQLASYFGVKPGEHAVLVRSVGADTPAQKAGLHAGDVILRLGAHPVHTVGEFWESLRARRGKATTLGVLRHGRPVTLKVPQVPDDAGAMLPDEPSSGGNGQARRSAETARRQIDSPQFQKQIEAARRQARQAAEQWRRQAEQWRQQSQQWQ